MYGTRGFVPYTNPRPTPNPDRGLRGCAPLNSGFARSDANRTVKRVDHLKPPDAHCTADSAPLHSTIVTWEHSLKVKA